MLSSTDQLRAISGYGMWTTGRKLHAELHRRLTDLLGEEKFAALMEQGMHLSFDQLIALGQELVVPSV